MAEKEKMQQRKFRYKCQDYDELFYSEDENFAYITRHNVIALYNGSMKFAEHEMMFTGLPDINGKDIYQDDIIKTNILGDEIIGVVMYSNIWAQFYLKTKNKHGIDIAMDSIHQWYYDGIKVIAEVIGNIYENKDIKC